ncbi:hypothetical protein BASA83_012614 [Batrachochytrium salamandrivorans]|nr:hypothetical protein BASA83_012614 [Batrachochytrium salamandrivorans]
MGTGLSSLRHIDWDEYLSYDTLKVVRIKDSRLGITYYIMLLSIVAYIIYSLVVNGSYLDKAPPVAGSIRVGAQLSDMSRAATPAYCTPTSRINGCLYWTAEQMVYPYSGEVNTIFLTTRVSIVTSPPPPPQCASYLTSNTTACTPPSYASLKPLRSTYYIAHVENITLQIDHSVRTQISGVLGTASYSAISNTQMTGKMLKGCTGDTDMYLQQLQFNETYRSDAPSTASGAYAGETWRSTGIVVSIPIAYTNRLTVGQQSSIKYTYVPAVINGSEYTILQTQLNADGSITFIDRHGMRIVFAQTGSIGVVSFLALTINLAAGMGLLSVATLICDLLLLYVFPRRAKYAACKIQHTEDFNPGSIQRTAHIIS